MTETVAVHPTDPFDSHALNAAEGLDPVDPAYAHVLRVSALLGALPVAVAATALDLLVVREIGGPYGLLTVLAWLLGEIAEIGRANVCTQVPNAHLVCRLLLATKKYHT